MLFFVLFGCAAFPGECFYSAALWYLHWPLVHCEEIHPVQALLSLSLYILEQYSHDTFGLFFFFLSSVFLMSVLSDCFRN